VRREGTEVIEATLAAEDAWVDRVRERISPCSNSPVVAQGANVLGKARVMLPYMAGAATYRARWEEVASEGYVGFVRTAAPG
jgi:hypothetical protein